MRNWFENLVGRFTWAQRFLLASLVILGVGMVGVGAWVGQQIESGVVHQSAANAALFVSSMVEPRPYRKSPRSSNCRQSRSSGVWNACRSPSHLTSFSQGRTAP